MVSGVLCCSSVFVVIGVVDVVEKQTTEGVNIHLRRINLVTEMGEDPRESPPANGEVCDVLHAQKSEPSGYSSSYSSSGE